LLGWGTAPRLPIYWPRNEAAERITEFESEFCPHADAWKFMPRAQSSQPPCYFRMAGDTRDGCPSSQERQCSIYGMHRILEHSVERSRAANKVPFNSDPAPRKSGDERRGALLPLQPGE
jgi:hypothetical protein